MIGKDEILGYIDQAGELEEMMCQKYKYLFENVEEPELKSRLEQLFQAEKFHAEECVKEMRHLVEQG